MGLIAMSLLPENIRDICSQFQGVNGGVKVKRVAVKK
jgi:hypothetical protein